MPSSFGSPAAARVGDAVTHSAALWGLLEGALVGAALGAILVASGGTAAPLLIAGAMATGASLGGTVGKIWGEHHVTPCGTILTGSPNVRINGQPAAFASSLIVCSQHSGPQMVAEGSASVRINGKPAARVGDHGTCGCVIAPPGSPNVFTGGAPVSPLGYAGEVPWYADAALFALGLAGGGALMAVKGLGAAAIAARLGGSVVGGTAGGAGGQLAGGRIFGERTIGQEVTALGGALIGGGLGYGFAARSFPSPATIAQRRATAIEFYRAQGFEESRIAAHLRGIDFNRPVSITTLARNTQVVQWQVPGAPQGTYYALPGVEPTLLGINPQAQLRGTTTVIDRVPTAYTLSQDVQALRSRAAPILDDWSVPDTPFQTSGGGTQYFTTSSSAFQPPSAP